MENFNFEELLAESVKTHGHLCPGQVLGVRMSILGLREIGIYDPLNKDRKKLIAFVEIDRCATDAVQSVTGCSLGKRSLKFLDYGKMAASFYNIETGKAVRITALEGARDRAKNYFPDIGDKYEAQLEAYKIMPDEELFEMGEVKIEIKPENMPGRPLKRVPCESCGEYVQDLREVVKEGKVFCRNCVDGSYYSLV